MKKSMLLTRAISFGLTVLMVASCFVALPLTASAETDLNKAPVVYEELDGPLWEIPATLPSGAGETNAIDHGAFSLWKTSANFKTYADPTDASRTVWGIQNYRTAVHLCDDEGMLDNYREFTFSVDLYFAAYPTGTRTSGNVSYTPDQLTLNLIKWQSDNADRTGIRMNSKGQLCDTNHKSIGYTVPLKEWTTLSVTIRPAEGAMILYANGKRVYQCTFTPDASFDTSKFYLLDGYYNYTAYMRDLSVSTSNREQWIGATHDDAKPPVQNSPLDYGPYSLYATSSAAKSADPAGGAQQVWGITNKSGFIGISDDENRLVNAAAFTVEAEMYFAKFPEGTRNSGGVDYTAEEIPLSLIKWQTTATAGGSTNTSNALRIGKSGQLFTRSSADSATGVYLPKNEWVTVSITVNPASGRYEVRVNGERVAVDTFGAQTTTVLSDIKFFDGYYNYSAYLRNIAVYTLDESDIGVTKEDTADYFGYQTKAISNGTFDVRFLSSVDPLAFAAEEDASTVFAGAGYEVTAVWLDAKGKEQSSVQRVETDTVYESINTGSGTFSMPDGSYIHAVILRGVDASLERIEFVVRPYADLQDGTRRYGDAAVMLWNGQTDKAGLPLLSRVEQVASYNTKPTDDTFIRLTKTYTDSDTDVNGDKTAIALKNLSSSSYFHYNRQGYLKFSFTETGVQRINDSFRVMLRLYASSFPAESAWTQTEINAGGCKMRLTGCATSWSEDTLCTDNNYPNNLPAANGPTFDFVARDDQWVLIDVTDYVKSCAKSGEVAFLLQAVSTIDTTFQFGSSESSYSPELVVYPTLYNHEVDLDKYDNDGYEPWANAEKLVSEWITEGYKNAYTAGDVSIHVDFDKMASTTDNGGSAAYTLATTSNAKLVASPTNAAEKVLGVKDSRSNFIVNETALALTAKDSFSVEADFYFESFPSGTRPSGGQEYAPNQMPMNLMRFNSRSGAINYGIRIDDHGELYYSSSGSSKTGVFAPLGEWFTIRIDYDLANMRYTVYLNDSAVTTKTMTGAVNMSQFYLLDGYFNYTAYMKDVRIYNHGGFATYELTEVDNTKPTGAYTVYSPWRHTQLKNLTQTKVYLRTVESLTLKGGYNASANVTPIYDQYGGISNAGFKGNITGYFHTEIIGGRTYIIDPIGNPYFAVGMNTVELGATDAQREVSLEKYGTAENFYSSVAKELRDIGVNTVWGGDWQNLIETNRVGTVIGFSLITRYMSGIRMNDTTGAEKFKHNNTMNVFDPDFATYAKQTVAATIGEYVDDPRVLGYTSDNEIPAEADMLYRYLTIDPSEPANAFSYAAAWTFLMARTGKANPSTSDITTALSEEFKSFVYDCYYKVVTAALDKAGAKQMYLGNRIHGANRTSEGYLRAASQYVDILTVNLYGGPNPPVDTIQTMYQYSGKPIIITEFYAKAQNTADMNGLPLMNATNAGWIVNTQEERGIHYESYVLRLLETRCCVGWTWYRFRDNDQRVYKDAQNNLYIEHDVNNGRLDSYLKIGTLNADGTFNIDPAFLAVTTDLTVSGDPYLAFLAPEINADNVGTLLTVIYKGEHGGDQSNNNSNKGLYDNHMNIYEPLAESFKTVSDNLMGLVNYFDALYGN
ncbi:MAG: DNRLRE domain-containing protein [Clostridia bacterium]|nr:DNRLRE domain-containing protein [Clostridia bacterium]